MNSPETPDRCGRPHPMHADLACEREPGHERGPWAHRPDCRNAGDAVSDSDCCPWPAEHEARSSEGPLRWTVQ